MIEIIILGFIALGIAAIIKWPLILWAAATIVGVLGLASKEIGYLALAIFLALIAWYLSGGIPFLSAT